MTETLKIPASQRGPLAAVVADPAVDAKLGGLGLDWATVPAELSEAGAAEWRRLAGEFADDETRFRESDRALVAGYCACYAVYMAASAELLDSGLLVEGRSSPDRERLVKNPAAPLWRQSASELRQFAEALAMSPRSRGAARTEGAGEPVDALTNPFAAPA